MATAASLFASFPAKQQQPDGKMMKTEMEWLEVAVMKLLVESLVWPSPPVSLPLNESVNIRVNIFVLRHSLVVVSVLQRRLQLQL